MAEYIEREEVLELMRNVSRDIEDVPEDAFPKDYADGWEDGLETAADKVESLFAADVRPKILGRWITQCGCKPFCSYCGYNEGGAMQTSWKYCPNCSAEMDGKDNDI